MAGMNTSGGSTEGVVREDSGSNGNDLLARVVELTSFRQPQDSRCPENNQEATSPDQNVGSEKSPSDECGRKRKFYDET